MVEAALAVSSTWETSKDRARLLVELGRLLRNTAQDSARGGRLLTEAVSVARRVGDPELLSEVLARQAGNLALSADNPDAANSSIAMAEEAVAYAFDCSRPNIIGLALNRRGIARSVTGNLEEGRADLDSAVGVFRGAGNRAQVAVALGDLANAEIVLNRFSEAKVHLEEAIEIASELKLYDHLRTGYDNAAFLAILETRWDDVFDSAMKSLQICRGIGNRRSSSYPPLLLALYFTQNGDLALASFLHGVHDAFIDGGDDLGSVPVEMRLRSKDIDRLRRLHGDVEFERHRDAGRAIQSLDDVLRRVTVSTS